MASCSGTKKARRVRITGVNYDITEREQTEEKLRLLVAQKDVMMRELQHRIKNNLTVVASLIGIGKDSLGPETRTRFFATRWIG